MYTIWLNILLGTSRWKEEEVLSSPKLLLSSWSSNNHTIYSICVNLSPARSPGPIGDMDVQPWLSNKLQGMLIPHPTICQANLFFNIFFPIAIIIL